MESEALKEKLIQYLEERELRYIEHICKDCLAFKNELVLVTRGDYYNRVEIREEIK